MDIVGTRGFKGKKAKNAHSQFNALFEEVEVDTEGEDSIQLEDEFSPDQLARLDQLEQDQV